MNILVIDTSGPACGVAVAQADKIVCELQLTSGRTHSQRVMPMVDTALALCELTCPADDPCPLVLDDTLVNFDDARAKRAMALFHEIAQHRQVILFTCHERDCPAQG